jgi:hypothetical protein
MSYKAVNMGINVIVNIFVYKKGKEVNLSYNRLWRPVGL